MSKNMEETTVSFKKSDDNKFFEVSIQNFKSRLNPTTVLPPVEEYANIQHNICVTDSRSLSNIRQELNKSTTPTPRDTIIFGKQRLQKNFNSKGSSNLQFGQDMTHLTQVPMLQLLSGETIHMKHLLLTSLLFCEKTPLTHPTHIVGWLTTNLTYINQELTRVWTTYKIFNFIKKNLGDDFESQYDNLSFEVNENPFIYICQGLYGIKCNEKIVHSTLFIKVPGRVELFVDTYNQTNLHTTSDGEERLEITSSIDNTNERVLQFYMLPEDEKGFFTIISDSGEYNILLDSIESFKINSPFLDRLEKLDLLAKANLSIKQDKTTYLKIPPAMWASDTNNDLDTLEGISDNNHAFCLLIKNYWINFQNKMFSKMRMNSALHIPLPRLKRGNNDTFYGNYNHLPLRQSSMPLREEDTF